MQEGKKHNFSSKKLAGKTLTSPEDIKNTFQTFYRELYTLDNEPNLNDINNFLRKIDLPTVTEDQIETLDKPFTVEEFHKALMLIPSNKAPGTDGFPAEFFRYFWQIISPVFPNDTRTDSNW